MADKREISLIAGGGLLASVVGSLAGAVLVTSFAALWTDSSSFGDVAASFVTALLAASIVAVPFGLVAGSIGAAWIVRRARRVYGRQLTIESTIAGALLAAAFPLMAMAGWGPIRQLFAAIPIVAPIGAVCGLAFAWLVERSRPHVVE